MPCFDQSGRRHVALPGSKISTPFLILSTMGCLDRSNALSISGVYSNFVLGDSRWRISIMC